MELKIGMEEAENGKEAVDLLRSGKCYDLILMDKDMPVMDGHEVTVLTCDLTCLYICVYML